MSKNVTGDRDYERGAKVWVARRENLGPGILGMGLFFSDEDGCG